MTSEASANNFIVFKGLELFSKDRWHFFWKSSLVIVEGYRAKKHWIWPQVDLGLKPSSAS